MKIDRSLVGKVIKVKIPDRDFNGKTTLDKKTTIVGICTSAGYNEILGTKQVVIGRMPIFPITEFDVTLV
jgi:hypothetical protein